MIKVQFVKPASGGFGEFDLGEPVEYEGLDTADEYVAHCLAEVDTLTTDEGTETAARDADGLIHDQGEGKVVVFRDHDGIIQLWCVHEVPEAD